MFTSKHILKIYISEKQNFDDHEPNVFFKLAFQICTKIIKLNFVLQFYSTELNLLLGK